jgi:UDP-N-acetylglucosamine diphosphorylase / glucose-1-phosphate thymidylyltransferase / UDP-N-acetylgalactosamine diphosphorylase / glucosamine-1-phosphate N-acetyltransferase / galactosamine-1-phosphate N-acetyltransferase
MDAIIMCAGQGTRLKPITDTIPKPLVPIAGVSSLERTLEILPDEVDRIILVVGYLAEQIKSRIGDSFQGRSVEYVHQHVLDGTGGALRSVEASIRSDRFLILMGDDLYTKYDLERLAKHDKAMLCYRGLASGTIDAVQVDDQNRICEFHRPALGSEAILNTGAYALDRHWFATEPILVPGKTDEWSLPHTIPQFIELGHPIYAIEATFWMPVGTHEQLAEAEELLKEKVA